MIEEDNIKKDCSVSIYAHTRKFAGHVWMSLNDSQDQKTFYGMNNSKKTPHSNSYDSEIEHTLQKLDVFIHRVVGDKKIKFGRIPKRDDHEFAMTIPIDSEQYDTLRKDAQELEKKDMYYQILGMGANHENCVTIIEKLLFNAGIDLNYYLPPTTWVETVKSPCSLVMRGNKPTEKAEISFREPRASSKTVLSWVAETANAAETGLRNMMRQ